MNEHAEPASTAPIDEDSFTEEDFGHPRGTLVIVLIYALVFAGTWLGLYLWHRLRAR